MPDFITTRVRVLYCFVVIKAVRFLGWIGAGDAADWLGRVTGLRARLVELLYGAKR